MKYQLGTLKPFGKTLQRGENTAVGVGEEDTAVGGDT